MSLKGKLGAVSPGPGSGWRPPRRQFSATIATAYERVLSLVDFVPDRGRAKSQTALHVQVLVGDVYESGFTLSREDAARMRDAISAWLDGTEEEAK